MSSQPIRTEAECNAAMAAHSALAVRFANARTVAEAEAIQAEAMAIAERINAYCAANLARIEANQRKRAEMN